MPLKKNELEEIARIKYQYQSLPDEEGLTIRYLLSLLKSLLENPNE